MAQFPGVGPDAGAANSRMIWAAIVVVFALFAVTGPIKMITRDEPATSGTTPLITMAPRTFAPAVLTVARGTTVVFVNDDVVDHTVDSASLADRAGAGGSAGAGFASGIIGPGERVSLVLTDSLRYVCAIHPSMTGAIEIGP